MGKDIRYLIKPPMNNIIISANYVNVKILDYTTGKEINSIDFNDEAHVLSLLFVKDKLLIGTYAEGILIAS